MPSTRKTIKTRLAEQLQTITVDNGYDHNVTVFRGRIKMDINDLALMPALSILEAPENSEVDLSGAGSQQSEVWKLLITGWAVPDVMNPTDPADDLLGDVKRCLSAIRAALKPHERAGNTAWMLGGAISKLEIGGGICRPPDNLYSDASYFLLPLKIHYVDDTENP